MLFQTKYTAIYTKTLPSSLHSAEVYLEPLQMSKQEITSLEETIFTKNYILDVSKTSEYANTQETIKQSNHIRQRQIT